ncbi:ATP-binding protein [Sulfitobacter mediterraneus]|nr:ATP-binding protein [Sulfitobacter mediterraneus]
MSGGITLFSNIRMVGVLSIAALIGVLIVGRLEHLGDDAYLNDTKLQTTLELVELRENIRKEIIDRILKLSELATIVSQNPSIDGDQLSARAKELIETTPDLISIGIAPDLVVTRVIPAEGNERAIGLDYRSNKQQFPMVKQAMETGKGLITGPVNLVQGGSGLILRQPVYVGEGADKAPWGIISVVLDYEKFLAKLGLPDIGQAYEILIHDVSAEGASDQVLFGQQEILAAGPVLLTLDFPYGVWELAAVPVGGWPAHKPDHMSDRLLAFVLIGLALFLLWYIIRLADTRRIAEVRLSNAIDALDHGFIMFDPNDRLVLNNKKYLDIYNLNRDAIEPGASYEDLVLRGLKRGIFPTAVGREEEWLAEWNAKRGGDFDSEHFLSDGRVIKASDRTMPDGSIVGLRIDVSELKEAQLGAEAANKAKSDFMAVLSHELRTPLTVILGTARLSKQVDRLPKAKELTAAIDALPGDESETLKTQLSGVYDMISGMMEKLERSGEHLLFLVNEILDFAKIEASGLSLDIQSNDIGEIIQTAAGQMAPMVEQKGLELNVQPVSATLNLDAKRIQQVLMNLLGNATKFTDKGSVSLIAEVVRDQIEIRIKDTGMGIPPDQVERVFEPFHQVDSSNKRGIGGTGLGLAISREIIEAHGGTLSATSVEGEGSVFMVVLPLNHSG